MEKVKKENLRKIILLLTLTGLLFCISCGKYNQSSEVNSNLSSKTNSEDLNYTIVDESYETPEEDYQAVNIHVPVIKEINELSMVDYYNELLGKKLEDYKNKTFQVTTGDYYHLDYEITTMTNEMLSVVFRGETYNKAKSTTTRFSYTYNIDMKTGNTICLSDKNDVEKISEQLLSGEKLELVKPADADLLNQMQLEDYLQELQEFSKEEWIEKLEAADISIQANGDGTFTKGTENHFIYSYLKDGKTILVIKVDNSLGDYVEIMLP